MEDPNFIDDLIEEIRDARDLVRDDLSDLSDNQINWKPGPDRWSIGQCLNHLIVSDRQYFPAFEQIGKQRYSMSFWQRFSPLTSWFGRLFKKYISGDVGIKIPSPNQFKPGDSDYSTEIVHRYHQHLDRFEQLLSNCRETDLDKTVISSPVMGFITYNLRDTFQFMMQHQFRHINQALRVKAREGFPNGEE